MSLEKIHLRSLLQLFDAPPALRTSLLREDIRDEIAKEKGKSSSGGGDFFTPFWADAKQHVAEHGDLRVLTDERIEKNPRRKRLYPLLRDGFLQWWDEKRRWRNEPFKLIEESIKTQFPVEDTDCVIKVENLMGVEVVGQFNRVIYPYFSEEPVLTEQSARIGLWVLGRALRKYRQEDLRILDVLRSASFGVADYPLKGDEQTKLISNHKALVAEWNKLREEY